MVQPISPIYNSSTVPITSPAHLATEAMKDQSKRIKVASEGFFSRVQYQAGRIWNVFVIGFNVASESVTTLFFSILNMIHPNLAPRVEAIWYRVSNIFLRIKAAWTEEEVKEEIEGLRKKVKLYDAVVLEKDRLFVENQRLMRENSEVQSQKVTLMEENQFAINHRETLEEERLAWHSERSALVKEKDGIQAENKKLKQDKGALEIERDQYKKERAEAASEGDALINALGLKDVEIAHLLSEITIYRDQGVLNQSFERIAQVCGDQKRGATKNGMDLDLEGLIPTLQSQLTNAIAGLTETKRDVAGTVAEVKLQSTIRILATFEQYIQRVSLSFQLHCGSVDPVDTLLKYNEVRKVV